MIIVALTFLVTTLAGMAAELAGLVRRDRIAR
jgi:hypothetical protein